MHFLDKLLEFFTFKKLNDEECFTAQIAAIYPVIYFIQSVLKFGHAKSMKDVIYHIVETISQSVFLFFAINILIILVVSAVCLVKKRKIVYRSKTYFQYLAVSFIIGLICIV